VVVASLALLCATAGVLAALAQQPSTGGSVGAGEQPVDVSGLHGTLVQRAFSSPALRRTETMLVYLPPGYATSAKRYPMIVMLHGVPGRPEDFINHGFVSKMDGLIAAGTVRPFVAVFPRGSDRPEDDTEWADSAQEPGERWETYVAKDVINVVQHYYRVIPRRFGRAIAGMSMGGFGAMNIGLHYRGWFAAIASWSGYFNANTPRVHQPGTPQANAYSPNWYAPRMKPSLPAWHPALDFYVGSRDRFAGENAAFDRELSGLKVPHSFRTVPGAGHNWGLWTAQLPAELAFLTRYLS
jgi:enterochelin esterase-like enzyme